MEFHVSYIVTYICFSLIFVLSIVILIIILFVAGSITAILVFFVKESIQKEGRAPIAGTDFHQLIYFDTLFDYQTDIARKHQTYRLLKPSFSDMYTIAPANVEHVLKTNFSKYSKGQFNYNVVKDLLGDGIFAVDGDKWRQQRKLASYEFSTKVLREFSSDVFRATGVKLANKVGEAANSAAPFDMQDVLMKATLDSIFKVGFGVELNTLSGSDEFGSCFSKAFDESNYIVFRRYVDIFWETKKYFNIGLEAKLKKNIQVIDDFVFQLIRHKREQIKCGVKEKAKENILSRFILASQEQPEAITDQYLRDIILNFLIAGKDTSANTLSWFFYRVCKNPLVQEKIVDEIKHATGFKGLGAEFRDFAMSLTENVIDKMHYLHAALTETLRLYPAVPVDGKVADEDDVLPDGFKVKKGDGVYYLAYSMGRMISLWGEDAEDYRPERWLDNGSFKPESPFKFVAFNAGPRICLGKEFAYRQMKILAAMLLYFFKFKLEDESMTATYRVMFTLHIAKGLPLLAFHRCN
ncbi:cytochrome P450 704C1-like isoform X1 [Asparagus officinalis]|uniref:cytochrome P450 704C1-like isoform X1 n=2 Tax=Asparagus officinalis TaxID=4686 RepID=UPI00098E5FD2|nr:cytochrome P450 704C1-like isoform X1 [Asparagus officinalis]